MKLKAIIISPNRQVKIKTAKTSSDTLTVGRNTWAITDHSVFLRKKIMRNQYTPYVVLMEGEPKPLAYMDTFDGDRFEVFLKSKVRESRAAKTDAEAEEIANDVLRWKGMTSSDPGGDVVARPYLDRKFRQSPISSQVLRMAIVDEQRVKLMRGPGTPWWLIMMIIMAMVVVLLAVVIYALIAPEQFPQGGPVPGVIVEWLRTLRA